MTGTFSTVEPSDFLMTRVMTVVLAPVNFDLSKLTRSAYSTLDQLPESSALKADSIEDQLLAQIPKKAPQRDLTHLSILLAEDNIVNQKMTVRMLEKKGWKATAADNGRQVLDYLEKGTFDLVLMDAQMPVLDGFEATKLIREKEKQTGLHIPIVALTARAMSGDQEKCLSSGMDGYVAKPIDRQKLYEAIEKFF